MCKPIVIAILLAMPVALALDTSHRIFNRFVCDNGLVYCGSISCIPAGTNCCSDGSYCPLLEYCTLGSNGRSMCCPNGQICNGQGGSSPTATAGCKSGYVVCANKGCMPPADTCCSDGSHCLAQEYCTMRHNGLAACCASGVSCTENGGTSFSHSTEPTPRQSTVPLTTSPISLQNTEPTGASGNSQSSITTYSMVVTSPMTSLGSLPNTKPAGTSSNSQLSVTATLPPTASTTTALKGAAQKSGRVASWIYTFALIALGLFLI